MLRDQTIRNFRHYLQTTPPHMLPKPARATVTGAYDSAVRIRDFGAGGAYDQVAPDADDVRAGLLKFLQRKLESDDYNTAEAMLKLLDATAGREADDKDANHADEVETLRAKLKGGEGEKAMDEAIGLRRRRGGGARGSFDKMFPGAARIGRA